MGSRVRTGMGAESVVPLPVPEFGMGNRNVVGCDQLADCPFSICDQQRWRAQAHQHASRARKREIQDKPHSGVPASPSSRSSRAMLFPASWSHPTSWSRSARGTRASRDLEAAGLTEKHTFDERGIDPSLDKVRMLQDFLWNGTVVRIPAPAVRPARAACKRSPRARRLMHDQLADHRIVMRRHDVARDGRASRSARRAAGNDTCARSCPGQGWKLRSGSSALMRHSIAAPLMTMSSCLNGSGSPAAIRICVLIRSMPVTISVTGMLDLDAGVDFDEVEVVRLDRR